MTKRARGDKNYEMHVISHVHWDREWRYSFAETRLQLVEMLDRLLEILDSEPDFKCYHLDAHTILLEDYLEIRPEMESKLKAYIRSGQILVGPWYTLPEEFLVSGEALVRNLLVGHQVAMKFGNVMKVGYTPTSCGQISQLPQIYDGFDVNSIMFYRGLNPSDAKAEFLWQGADGTTLLSFHFYGYGRANFFALLLDVMLFGGRRQLTPKEKKDILCFASPQYPHLAEMQDPITAYHVDVQDQLYLTGQRYPYLHEAMSSLTAYHGEKLEAALAKAKADAVSNATTGHLLYMDGCDNGAPHPHTIRIIKDANRMSASDKYIHTNLPDYVENVRRAAKNLQVLTGEMRRQAKDLSNALYAGILSARTYIKQRNARTEYNLIGRAEPWAAIAWLLGHEYPKGQLDRAWKYLLANQTHDGLQACSADPVHDDMEYRYNQCDEMSAGILRRSLCGIVSQLPTVDGDELYLIIFNPLAHRRSEVVTADIRFPTHNSVSEFSLYDGDRQIPSQIMSHERGGVLSEWLELNTRNYPVDRFAVSFLAENIPPMGYKIFRVVPGKQLRPRQPKLVTSPRTMENAYLSVTIKANGSLKICDKQTGHVYDNLHVFEDRGEIGDSLQHRPVPKDRPITSSTAKASISLARGDSFSATYKVTIRLSLPIKASSDQARRAAQRKTMAITSHVTLRRGARRVDITTTFDNQTSDHQLRVLIPSGINANRSWAAGQFDVLARPIKSPHKKGWAEEHVTTMPNYGFVDIADRKRGLAILNEGLTAYQVEDDKERTIALTLVRAFENVCGVPSRESPGAQCLRHYECRYAIYPHAGDYRRGNVYQELQRFGLALEAAQCGRRGGPLGDEIGFFELGPDCLILSALKRSENGKSIILRFFNPTNAKIPATVRCFRPVKKAWLTNLNEDRQRELTSENQRCLSLDVAPKKIITLEIMLNKRG